MRTNATKFLALLCCGWLAGCASSGDAQQCEVLPPEPAYEPPSSDEDEAEAALAGWYTANRRGLAATAVTPASIPPKVRRAYRAPFINARRENSFIVWASAWTGDGGREGFAVVEHLTLEAVMADGRIVPIASQRYNTGDSVWGGWFPYTGEVWYKLGMVDENDFDVRCVTIPEGGRMTGAFINTASHTGEDAAAGHIWMKRWPRDVPPPGTVALRVSARFVARGDCLINVGMDRYRLPDADPEPEQECLVSETYSAEHGAVDVVMVTPDIEWLP